MCRAVHIGTGALSDLRGGAVVTGDCELSNMGAGMQSLVLMTH